MSQRPPSAWWGDQVSDIHVEVDEVTPEERALLGIPSCCSGAGPLLVTCGLFSILFLVLPLAMLEYASVAPQLLCRVLNVTGVALMVVGFCLCCCFFRRTCCEGIFLVPEHAPLIPPLSGRSGVKNTVIRNVLLIYNPNAGKRSAESICTDFVLPGLEERGIRSTVVATEYAGHARNIAQTADISRIDAMVCLGGDGTFHEMVNGMLSREDKKRVPVTVIPVGSGNAFTATLRQNMRRRGAELAARMELGALLDWSLDRVADGNVAQADVLEIQISGRKLVSIGFIFLGLLGEVDILAEPFRCLGPARLELLSLWSILKRSSRNFICEVSHPDGRQEQKQIEALGISVSLLQHWTDTMRASPLAQIDDGVAEFHVVPASTSVDELLASFLQMPVGAHDLNLCEQVEGVAFQFDGPGVVNIDGEILQHDGSVGLKVLPRHLDILIGEAEKASAAPAAAAAGTALWRTYTARWAMLAIYCLGSMSVQAIWIGFAPVHSDLVQYYGVSDEWVNFLALSYMVAYVPLTFPASYTIDVHGCRVALVFGVCLNALGAALRCIRPLAVGLPMDLLMVGQVLCACAQPFFTNMPPKIAMVWFPCYQRAFADTVASMSATVGAAIGFILPTTFGIQSMLYIQMAWAILAALATISCFEAVPPTPPSPASEHRNAAFTEELLMALRNKRFWCLLVAFSCSMGSFSALSILAEALTSPFGFSADDASRFGVLIVVAGLLGAAVMTAIVGYTQNYKKTLTICLGLATFFGGASYLAIVQLGSKFEHLADICFSGLGFSALPIMPVAFEAAVEAARPTGEGTLAGLCMSGGQVVGISLTMLATELLNRSCAQMAWLLCLALFVLAFASICLFDGHGTGVYLELEDNSSESDKESVLEESDFEDAEASPADWVVV